MSKNGSVAPTTKMTQGPKDDLVDFKIKKSSLKTSLWVIIGLGFSGFFFHLFAPILMPFLVALIFAYALNPVVERLQNWGLNRSAATFLLVLSALSLIVGVLFIAIPFLRDELTKLTTTLPKYMTDVATYYTPQIKIFMSQFSENISGRLETTLTDHASNMLRWSLSLMTGIFTNTLALANIVSLIILSPLLIFYLLRDWPLILGTLHKLIPPTMTKKTMNLIDQLNETLNGYFRGQAAVCLLMAAYYTTGLYIIGLDYAFTVGIISGLLTFMPYVGFLTGLVAAVGVALVQFTGYSEVILIAGLYGLGNVFEGFILVPRLVGSKIGLHPIWLIFALLGGGFLFGFLGILLAIPLAAVVAVFVRFGVSRYHSHLQEISPQKKSKIDVKKKRKNST